MRLKQFINESRGKSISKQKAADIIKSNCKQALNALKNDNVIYRGIKESNAAYIISPSKFTRVSLNTENYYTLINDNSPAWSKYPKRSKSIICTTNYNDAEYYGSIYVVLPFDAAKIGVCKENDYWSSFPFLEKKTNIINMALFNDDLKYIFDIPEIKENVGSIKDVKSYTDLIKLFNDFDNFIKKSDDEFINNIESESGNRYKKLKHSPTLEKFISEYSYIKLLRGYEEFMNMKRYLQYLLDPKKNKFELKKIGDKLPKNKEVWTDSDSILIKGEFINSLSYL